MKGIILLNRQVYSGDTNGEVRLLHDAGKLLDFAQNHQIELIKLNPDQLNSYYTIPFALHHDLKTSKVNCDYLLIHSSSHFKDFRIDYSEYWEEIRNHFTFVAEAERHIQQKASLSSEEIRNLPPISNL